MGFVGTGGVATRRARILRGLADVQLVAATDVVSERAGVRRRPRHGRGARRRYVARPQARRAALRIKAVSAHLVASGVTMLSDEMDYISRKLRFIEGPEGITLEARAVGPAGRLWSTRGG